MVSRVVKNSIEGGVSLHRTPTSYGIKPEPVNDPFPDGVQTVTHPDGNQQQQFSS